MVGSLDPAAPGFGMTAPLSFTFEVNRTNRHSRPAMNVPHPPGFRARRGLNWGCVGLLYTSFYMCRYNLPIANRAISAEFGFSKSQMGWIISTALFAYACGQIVNGLLTDRLGGKRAMLIGAAGTIVMNTLFGIASFAGLLAFFVTIRGIDGYLQAFGAPGMVKINAAWFRKNERGRFAGIFGFMINAGRFAIGYLGPALLGGFMLFGLIEIPPQHWRWLFWVPAGITATVALVMALNVKDTPQQAGFPPIEPETSSAGHVRTNLSVVLRTIATNPVVWIVALAYACTGAVRQSIDQWFPRFMQEAHHVELTSAQFQILVYLIPLVATLGSLVSGYVSDLFFNGRRAPVAAALYFLETAVILAAAQFSSVNGAIVFLIFIAFTANSTHSILGTAAAMDIGGAEMAGFTTGLIDSFQYFGGSLAGFLLGALLDKSWGSYFYFMAPFGLIGGCLMLTIIGRISLAKPNK
jgi:MFS transporter, OPA family, glycerol-3-phosphate transporter